MTQRGQQWVGTIQFNQPVIRPVPLAFAPTGVGFQFTIGTVPGGSTDDTVITYPSSS